MRSFHAIYLIYRDTVTSSGKLIYRKYYLKFLLDKAVWIDRCGLDMKLVGLKAIDDTLVLPRRN